MTKLRTLFTRTLLAAFALTLTACATDNVTSNVAPSTDLSQYKTYAFLTDLSSDKGARYNSLETTYLKNAVSKNLDAAGMTKDMTNPDVVFNFSVETQEKVQSRPTAGGYGGVGYDPFYDDYYYGGWGYGHSMRIDQFTEGKLVIDAIDPREKKMIWQGTTKGRLTTKAMQNMEETLTAAVDEIFEKLPPVAQ